jgi:AbrB family looped-hinge helix DNA binding protein
MRVTRKGQVTIPQAVREALGIVPGTLVEITASGDHAVIRPAERASTRGELLARRLEGTASGGLSTDEVMMLTRGEE